MQELFLRIHAASGLSPILQGKIGATLLVIFLVWLLQTLAGILITRGIRSSKYEYELRRAVSYLGVFLTIVIIGRIWFSGFQSLTTIIGLTSAGLAIALKDPLANIAGWFYLLWDDPFDVGDRIEIDGVRGDIVDQRLCHFSIMEMGNWVQGDQNTGRIIHIPNSSIFTKPLVNYNDSFPYLWDEMQIRITFESDWKKAKSIVTDAMESLIGATSEEAQKALNAASHRMMIYQSKNGLKPVTFVSVKEWGVQISAHYVVDCFKRRIISAQLWEAILTAFDNEPDILFAYPSLRIHNREEELHPTKLG